MFALILASLTLFATLAVVMAGLGVVTGSRTVVARGHSAREDMDGRARRAGL